MSETSATAAALEPTASPKHLVITTPPPTPNGPLHLGHLSGPYIAGDIAIRAARARGHHVLAMSGLDEHQNYVATAARVAGVTEAELIERHGGAIRRAMAAARIGYDVFLQPTLDADYRRGTIGLLDELLATGALADTEVRSAVCGTCDRTLHHSYVSGSCATCGAAACGGTCEGCGSLVTAADLTDPVCTACGSAPQYVTHRAVVLSLERYRDAITQTWAHGYTSPQVRALVSRLLTSRLPDVTLTYPTDWGIRTDALGDGHRVDVWAEMGLGYLYAVGRHINPQAGNGLADLVGTWESVDEVWHFLGMDNAFYYAVLFPALFAAAGLPATKLRGIVSNEFLRLAGSKFSTSRNHAIWAAEFLADEDPATVRLYASWNRPDHHQSDFSAAAYHAFARTLATQTDANAAASALSGIDTARADTALQLPTFDPAIAVRSLWPVPTASQNAGPEDTAPTADDTFADALRAVVTGTPAHPAL